MRLYDNPFSPFARKVRMVLGYKEIPYDLIDALRHDQREALEAANPRAEVPVLEDGDVVVCNSADIIAYLEHRYPEHPVYPADPAARVAARAWERLSDTTVDAIMHDISIWMWFTVQRADEAPPGLVETGTQELLEVFDQMEMALGGAEYLCGTVSIADFALFPHVGGARLLGIPMTEERHPQLRSWLRRMREIDCCRRDLAYMRDCMTAATSAAESGYERTRIKWRGDRLEWLLSRGFHEWWYEELRAGRVEWPRRGPGAFPGALATS